jgi:hypothetical protein
MLPKTLILAAALTALAACVPEPPLEPGYVPAASAEGPRLQLAVEVDGPTAIARVVAQEVTDVFGLSFHLTWDGAQVDGAVQDAPAFLDPDGADAALHIARATAGDAALGGARRHPELGGVDLLDETLAVVELTARADGASSVALTDVVARRADGSFLPVAAAAGELTLAEGGAR